MNPNLNEIVLSRGAHASREKGVCAMELVAWLAGEKHSDGRDDGYEEAERRARRAEKLVSTKDIIDLGKFYGFEDE